MFSVIKITSEIVYVGNNDGYVKKIPISCFDDMPKIGMELKVYETDDGEFIIVPVKKDDNIVSSVLKNTNISSISENVNVLDIPFISGRMKRSNFIITTMIVILVLCGLAIINDTFRYGYSYRWVRSLINIGMFSLAIFWIMCFIRRIHDIGTSSIRFFSIYSVIGAFFMVCHFLFKVNFRFIGPLFVFPLVIGLKDGEKCSNKYGPYLGD